DYIREEELRLCLEGEEKMRCEHQNLIFEENRIRLDEAKRLRAPPIKEHHGLFETYLSKLEKTRKHGKTGFMVSSIGGETDNVLAHERSDRQAKLKFTDEFYSMTSDLCDSLNSMFADLIRLIPMKILLRIIFEKRN
nr:hypothetical protein [Tanacetum cinerariifolium]